MVIDTSAILAILLQEQDSALYSRRIQEARHKIASASMLLETSIVMLARHGTAGIEMLDDLRAEAGIGIVPFRGAHALLARDAFRRFGKGRHRAALNFGDCISYALARTEAMPLLFKGDDFRLTDIEAAL